jgi:hypothetical protein
MTEGRTTSRALVQAYLNRIEAFDRPPQRHDHREPECTQ